MYPNNYPFVVELANTMDWDMTAADFEFNKMMEPDGCFILLENAKPVGAATCISYGKVGWFGNLIVSPAARKRGAGTFLLNHAVNYLKNAGVKTIGLYAYPYLVEFYGPLPRKAINLGARPKRLHHAPTPPTANHQPPRHRRNCGFRPELFWRIPQ
jgi:GNAT superfamily N-acetyltransferase